MIVKSNAAVLAVSFTAASAFADTNTIFINKSNITVANLQIESGSDVSDNPNIINGPVGSLISFTGIGAFDCCSNYKSNRLNDGDIGAGVASNGLYAIPTAGNGSLTLDFGAVKTIGSIAIYNGYANRDDGLYTLKDGAGNILGSWTIAGTVGMTNDGVSSFWLKFNNPVTTNKLVFDTTSYDAQNTNSYREIQVFTAAVPEPETYAMLLAGLGLMGGIARRRKQK